MMGVECQVARKNTQAAKNPMEPTQTIGGIEVKLEDKCGLCTAKCCTYITHQIDTPRSLEEFDYLIWQVSHRDVKLFKDDDGWFLSVISRCNHILPDGRCAIYHQRPQICRDHSNECCEFDGPAEDDYELFFDGFEALDTYCRKRFKQWDRRFKK